MAGRKTGAAGVEPGLALPALEALLAGERLEVLGGFAVDEREEGLPAGTRTVLMLGPKEPGFWAHLQAQPEWGGPDPVDRWSRRVIGRIACDLGAKALFPFGGPPYHPFYQWALRTGRVWDSPVRPCDGCAAPCLTACPVGALTGAGYDLPTCHAWLDQPRGADCLSGGCLVRRACPVSQSYARLPEQSAYHMRQFHR